MGGGGEFVGGGVGRGGGRLRYEKVTTLNFGSLKRRFLHFEGTFEQNIKVSNHIFNSDLSKCVNR